MDGRPAGAGPEGDARSGRLYVSIPTSADRDPRGKSVSNAKRQRQKANRRARAEASQPVLPTITDADLDQLLGDVIVRTDCEHASTRTTADGPVLTRCALGAAVAGGCLRDCESFERRRVGGIGLGFGAGA